MSILAQTLIGLGLPLLLAYVCFSDLFRMKITNRVCLATFCLFFVFAAVSGLSLAAVGMHLLTGAIVFAICFALFAIGQIGGGDAKFMVAVSVWFGFDHVLEYLLLASVFGGVLTVGILVARNQPLPAFAGRMPWLVHLHDPKTRVPYGIALGSAALIALPATGLWLNAFRPV